MIAAMFSPRRHAFLGGQPGAAMSRKDGGGVSLGLVASVAAHAALLAGLLWLTAGLSRSPARPSPIIVNVVESPDPEPPGPPAPDASGEAAPDIAEPIPQQAVAPVPPPEVEPEPVEAVGDAVTLEPPNTSDLLSESQLAGAMSAEAEGSGGGESAGGGSGGGGCNTARVLQRALQRDPMVSRAVMSAGRAGKAVMLWDGAWVRSGDQDGKGLSGVRQALTWELAFTPAACRDKRMQGLVVLSLVDGTRFAIGAENWRWSDLLEVPEATGR